MPKLIYTIINFSNPSGACLSEARRRRLAEIARELGIPVLEDDPYGELRYRGERIPTLFSLAGGGVIFASSFSKILAPGVRVAWAVGEAELIRKMVIAKQGMDLCTSVVAQVLVAEYCSRGFLESHLVKIRAHYAGKAAAMGAALREHLPSCGSLRAAVRRLLLLARDRRRQPAAVRARGGRGCGVPPRPGVLPGACGDRWRGGGRQTPRAPLLHLRPAGGDRGGLPRLARALARLEA